MVNRKSVPDEPARLNDELIAAYLRETFAASWPAPEIRLADVAAEDAFITVEEAPVGRLSDFFSAQTIPLEKRISLTISVARDGNSKKTRCKSESLIVLLKCLHFLKQPMSPALRRTFLTAAEQSIEDYRAADWYIPVTACSGVVSEVSG